MIASKHITAVVAILLTVALVLCFLGMAYADKLTQTLGGSSVTMEYTAALFDTDDILQIDILMDDAQWEEMLQNAIGETFYTCDVVVNGTTFRNVGIRPKGNTSLSSIASDPDNDRYSFKLEFDHFVDGQTCFGLDKLILNNNYADATSMKETLVYDMFAYLGADASLYNYAKVSVNAGYWGVYLALEAVEDSFMLRNYGAQRGELYKPESLGIGGGDKAEGFAMPENMQLPEGFTLPDDAQLPEGFSIPEGFDPSAMKDRQMPAYTPDDTTAKGRGGENGNGGFGGGFGGSMGGGADLVYTDDALSSYSTIWDGAITASGDADHARVVTALKNINAGTELETYLDVDNILRYMAVHAFAVNDDSLSGSMAHNYYLYEYGGKLNLLPWDYNLSFGGMRGNDASAVVNDPIDTPFSGTTFFDALLENEAYLATYHEYCRMLAQEYVEGGRFAQWTQAVRAQIDELTKTDPNAMYTYEEYQDAATMLASTVALRAESILGQLDGSIPSTQEGQRADASALVDATGINISTMGTFSMGGGNGGGERTRESRDEGVQPPAQDGDAMQPPQNAEGSAPAEDASAAGGGQAQQRGFPGGGQGGMPSFPMQGETAQSSGNALLWIAVSAVVIAAALGFAVLYKPKGRRR